MKGLLAALALCIAVGVFFRFDALDHLPGINGDETFNGVKSWMSLHGQPIRLRTSAGSFPDPLSTGSSWLVYLFMGPSPVALRLPVVLVGLATVLAAFLIGRRLWGRDVGLVAAALTACLPTHIMYSRFFWEPSGSPLACALWLMAAYSGRVLWFMLAATFAILVHPTNVFLLPMVSVVMLMRTEWRERLRGWSDQRARYAIAAILVIALASFFVLYLPARGGNPNVAWHRLRSPTEWLTFAASFSDVITGSASYRYIVGPMSEQAIVGHRFAYLVLVVVPVVFSLIRDWRRLGSEVMGFVAALAVFYVMGGMYSISPATERYGLWLTMPNVFIAARAWSHVWEARRVVMAGLAAAACVAALVDMNVQYFQRLRSSNSVTENTFKTGDIEPKVQAFRFIRDHADPSRRTRVYAENWWTYWPIRYLSLQQSPAWEVTILNSAPNPIFPPDFWLPPSEPDTRQVFYVGYAGWRFTGTVLKQAPGAVEQAFGGYGGDVIVSVFTPRAGSAPR